MEFNMEWDIICRVCLQEGEMCSLYEKDEKDMTYSDKIMQCSNITIKRGMCLPEQICKRCIEDLNAAYRFRTNCESSDAILQSFTEGNVVTDLIMTAGNGEYYKYKPPQGLNVKRIKPIPVKLEPFPQQNIDENTIIAEEHHFTHDDIEESIDEQKILVKTDDLKSEIVSDDPANITTRSGKVYKSQINLAVGTKDDLTEQPYEVSEEGNICTLKPVKTNKARSKAAAEKNKPLKIVSAQTVTTKPDGTTVLRVRRNFEEQKPQKICEICGNTYKYKHALESHMRRHRNEKPFACEICGRSFVINFELRRHMRTHTGQKPYACRYCGRRFSDFGSRIKHERTHTGERPYKCETCGKTFAYSHVLTSHILTHTGEKRYLCGQCGKRFTKAHHLKAHLNTHLKNQSKPVILRATIAATETVNIDCNPTVYEQNDKVYEDVLTVLTAQPKLEQFDEIEEIQSEEESRQAVSSINMAN